MLAPDRFLAVFGVATLGTYALIDAAPHFDDFLASILPYWVLHFSGSHEMLMSIKPFNWTVQFVHWVDQIEPGEFVTKHQMVIKFISVTCLFFVSVLPTFWLCRQDPQLYAKIVTQNIDTQISIYFLSTISSKIIQSVIKQDPNWYFEDSGRMTKPTSLVNVLAENTTRFETIEEVKKIVAPRFGLTTRVFCDQFFKFSPSVFIDRITKVDLNNRFLSDDHEEDYRTNLYEQSRKIRENVQDQWLHLRALRSTNLNMTELEALFITESNSGSVQRLAQILGNPSLTIKDCQLLFVLVGAYRGHSLFRRLLATTLSQDLNSIHGPLEYEKLKHRLQALIKASKSEEERIPRHIGHQLVDYFVSLRLKIYSYLYLFLKLDRSREENLKGWFHDTSAYLHYCRKLMIKNFEKHLNNNYKDTKGTVFIISNSYSRAVRSALGSLRVVENPNICVFIVQEDCFDNPFSPRLLHHVTKNETWKGLTSQSELRTGTLELLKSIVGRNDSGIYLSGAASVEDETKIYGTTNPELVTKIEEIFPPNKNENRFEKIVLAASYKRIWPNFYNWIKEKDRIVNLPVEVKPDERTLGIDRDPLLGGLYPLIVTKVISEV